MKLKYYMIRITRIRMKGYYSIYQYHAKGYDGYQFVTYVPKLKDFQEGLKDCFGNGNVMTAEQAEWAKTYTEINIYNERIPDNEVAEMVPHYNEKLAVNNFELKLV